MRTQPHLYIFVAVLFLVGGIFGALLFQLLTLEQQQDLMSEVKHFMNSTNSVIGINENDLFWNRFVYHLKWILLIWLLGVTVIGIPFILALNFLKGMLVGFSIGVLVHQYAWEGVLLAFVSIAPQNLIAVPALIIASAAAISFGLYVIKNRLLFQRGTLLPQLGMLTSTTILILLLFTGVSLFEAYLTPSFTQWAITLLI